MIKWANPTANMNVRTELTEKTREVNGILSDDVGLGVHTADFCFLGLAAEISSKRSLCMKYARVVSSRSAPIENKKSIFPIHESRYIEIHTFQLNVASDSSVDSVLEPLFDPLDFPHIRQGWIALPFAAQDAEVVKPRALVTHEAVCCANVPFHYLATVEIAHVTDIGVG